MKNKTSDSKANNELHHIVVPFSHLFGTGSQAAADGLFDDCPLCVQMREEGKSGRIEIFESRIEEE